MSKLNSTFPWFPFGPRDWLEGTRDLTLEQRGAYIDMICLQMLHEGPIREDYAWLAHQLHCPKQRARKLVNSLIEEMKFRRTPDGMLSNDRCEMELQRRLEISRRNSENAKRRSTNNQTSSHPKDPKKLQESSNKVETLLQQTSNFVETFSEVLEEKTNKNNDNPERAYSFGTSENDAVADTYKSHSNSKSPCVESPSPTTDSEQVETMCGSQAIARLPGLEDPNPKSTAVRPDYSAAFELFWKAYPHRENRGSKGKAFENWKRLSQDHRALTMTAVDRLLVYLDAKPEKRAYTMQAQRYLTSKPWTIEYETDDSVAAAINVKSETRPRYWWQDPDKLAAMTLERWRVGILKITCNFTADTWSVPDLGPAPGDPDCVVPFELVCELHLDDLYDRFGRRTDLEA